MRSFFFEQAAPAADFQAGAIARFESDFCNMFLSAAVCQTLVGPSAILGEAQDLPTTQFIVTHHTNLAGWSGTF